MMQKESSPKSWVTRQVKEICIMGGSRKFIIVNASVFQFNLSAEPYQSRNIFMDPH
jgi:inosine-uridine nucleoside N-ribohydrolase